MVDYILSALMSLFTWATNQAVKLIGIDIADWKIVEKLSFAYDSLVFCDKLFPLIDCLNLLVVGFAVKISIMVARYIIGWLPGIDG